MTADWSSRESRRVANEAAVSGAVPASDGRREGRRFGPVDAGSWLIRVAVLLHALALFAIVFSTRQTQFGNVLFLKWFIDLEDPYAAAILVEKITVSLYLLAGLIVLFRPYWPLLLLMAAYAFMEAASGTFNAGYRFSEWTIPAHALRYGLPLVLLTLVVLPKIASLRNWTVPVAAGLLRVLVAVVFVTHGYQALMEDPRFIDLIIGSFGNLFNVSVGESTAVAVLKVIAVIDFCVALAALIYPRPLLVPHRFWASPCRDCAIRRVIVPGLMIWLAFWGLITALSRMTAMRPSEALSEYPELLVRVPHVLGPLALWCLFAATYRTRTCRSGEEAEPAGASREVDPSRPAWR